MKICKILHFSATNVIYNSFYMKFLFRYSLLLVLFAGTQLSAIAQNTVEEWDWSKCLQHTIDNNLQLKQAEINIQLGEATLKQQKLNYSPSVNASTNYNLRVGNNFNFFTSAYTQELVHFQDYGLNVSQPVFDGLIIANNIKKSKLDVEALQFDQQTLQNNIVLQMLAAFLNIMNAKEQEQQALQQQQITREQYERIKTMIEAGAAAEQATLDIEAQLASEELTLAQINNQLALAYLQLKIILQLPVDKDITVKIPALPESWSVAPLSDVMTVYNNALQSQPQVKSSQLKTKSAEKAIDIAKGNYYPSLNLIANASTFYSSQNKITRQQLTGNTTAIGIVEGTFQRVLIPETQTTQSKNPYGKQLNQNFNYAVGLGLTIPIYNKYQVKTAVKQSRLQHQLAIINEQQTNLELYNNIQQAYLKASASLESYKAAEKNYRTAQKSYDYATERLQAGSIQQLDVNLAKSNLLIALSRLSQSKYEYLFNSKVLDFYEGKPITLE